MKYPALLENENLAQYSYYRIGGKARYFYVAKSLASLKEILVLAKQEKLPIFILGSGSNVLFPDDGFPGLVIKNECREIRIEANLVKAAGGALLKDVIQVARKNNLVGLEEFWGLPGTIGGAVRGNAGSFGKEMKDFVKEVRVLRVDKELVLTNKDAEFAYRDSRMKLEGDVVLEVILELKKTSELPALNEFLEKRQSKQPAGLSCGSFFKNPAGEKSAGQLIEEAGLKGLRVGGAQVSEQHANFILNVDGASFQDIINLKNQIQQKVAEKFGVKLEPEVMIVK